MEHRKKTITPEQKAAFIAAGEAKRQERAEKKKKKEAEQNAFQKSKEKERSLKSVITYLNSCDYHHTKPDPALRKSFESLLTLEDYKHYSFLYGQFIMTGLMFENCWVKEVAANFWKQQLQNGIVDMMALSSALGNGYISKKVCDILLEYYETFTSHAYGKHIFFQLDQVLQENGKVYFLQKKFVPLRKDKREAILKILKTYLGVYLKRFTEEGYPLSQEFADVLIRYHDLTDEKLRTKIAHRLWELKTTGEKIPQELLSAYAQ